MIKIETQRLMLSNVTPEDAPTMFDYRNNEVCARYQRGQTKDLPGIIELLTRRQNDSISDQENFMVGVRLKESNQFIGEIVAMPNDGCFSIGYTFHYAQHRKGYAYEALKALTDLLHERYPSMEFISFTEPENTASRNLLKKLGYKDMGYVPKLTSQVYGKWVNE